MRTRGTILASIGLVCAIASRASAVVIYAQTGFNDQSGINSDATAGSPYALDQTINGRANGEPGWSGPWVTLNGGAQGGDANAVVKASSAFEGDGGLAVTVAPFGSTQFYRDFAAQRTDHFVVETRANFGSVGEFQGLVIQDNYPLAANNTGPAWRLTGAVGSRHFEVFDGTYDGLGTWENTGIAQKPGQWQMAVADIDVVTQQWTFSVDGVMYNAPDPLGYERAVPQLNALYYFDTAAGSVDSIVVREVPEPGSLGACAAAGALISLARRRRPRIASSL
jgi:hypothetical protein